MSDAPELKPCPFCGSLAWLRCYGGVLEMGRSGYRIECEGKCHAMTCYWHTSAEAITAWNTRTSPIDRLDQIEIYRLIKKAGVRKHGEIAKVIADHLSALTPETDK